MKKTLSAVCGAFAILIIPALAQTGAKAKDPALQAAIEARQKAIDTRNTAEWAKYTTDDYVQVTAEGEMNSRSVRMKNLAATAPNTTPASVVIEAFACMDRTTRLLFSIARIALLFFGCVRTVCGKLPQDKQLPLPRSKAASLLYRGSGDGVFGLHNCRLAWYCHRFL
jgi:hypothetical protein